MSVFVTFQKQQVLKKRGEHIKGNYNNYVSLVNAFIGIEKQYFISSSELNDDSASMKMLLTQL